MNKIEINIPEGFEIDKENSDFSQGLIQFKPIEKKKLTYEDIAKELFQGKRIPYLSDLGTIIYTYVDETFAEPNNATSRKQLECLMAYNKLRNVAEYLNKGELNIKDRYSLYYDRESHKIKCSWHSALWNSNVYFNSSELALQALEILGEEEIKKALFIIDEK